MSVRVFAVGVSGGALITNTIRCAFVYHLLLSLQSLRPHAHRLCDLPDRPKITYSLT